MGTEDEGGLVAAIADYNNKVTLPNVIRLDHFQENYASPQYKQSALAANASERRNKERMDQMGDRDLIRKEEQSQRGAHEWKHPAKWAAGGMTPAEYRATVWRIAGFTVMRPPQYQQNETCGKSFQAGNICMDRLDPSGWHFTETCKGSTKARHDRTRDALGKILEKAGFYVQYELPVGPEQQAMRMDIVHTQQGNDVVMSVDLGFTTMHPANANLSNRLSVRKRARHHLKQRLKAPFGVKNRTYKAWVERDGGIFTPFIMGTMGTICYDGYVLLLTAAAEMVRRDNISAREARARVFGPIWKTAYQFMARVQMRMFEKKGFRIRAFDQERML